MLQTPPGSRTTSPVPVNTPVHRASRRIRGLPPEAEADVTRQVNSTSDAQVFTAIGSNTEYLRELIRSVVREELQKVAAPPLPTVSSIASIIKDELHQALRDPVTLDNTTAVPTEYRRATYAEALKRPASSPPLFVHAPPTVSLQSAQQLQYCEDTRTSPPFVYAEVRVLVRVLVVRRSIIERKPATLALSQRFELRLHVL
ncbi:hypothetical protein HPB52_023738 [Rhipicephalus sanguineus]|uniref:Uncharacterized protein n=1 Tax=Rhipicephalus sanguineus TaxID=34632 RepID=A0A9D4Q4F5_RHISA|nr:hypothetical protein HPB52_023738 [Rhipicephalus sanguineus]